MIMMSKEERLKHLSKCKDVVHYLWNIYKPLCEVKHEVITTEKGDKLYKVYREIENFKPLIIKKTDKTTWSNIYEKLLIFESHLNNSELYQYSHLYVTTLKWRAESYARRSFAGGELALIAYRFIECIEILEWKHLVVDEVIQQNIMYIKNFANHPQPVVIAIDDMEEQYLKAEDNKDLLFFDNELCTQNLKYINEYNLTLDKAEYQ
jgi:hypothetical protein